MAATETRVLDSTPSSVPLMVKAALPGLPGVSLIPGIGKKGGQLPDLRLVRRGVRIDPAHVASYAEVCEFPTKDTLPLPYAHLLAFPLHMTLMTDGAFPFPALGTVHLENSITQHRPLTADDELDIAVWSEHLRAHPKGKVYDVCTEIVVDTRVAWEERSTFLVRGRGESDAATGLDLPQVPAGATTWKLGADLGRRYAAVSGDRNPIHLYALTAKAFGFPRQIAHGMWSMARCVAQLENRLPDAVTVDVAFKTPVLLPGTVAFGSDVASEGIASFSLSNPRNGAPHLVGRAAPPT